MILIGRQSSPRRCHHLEEHPVDSEADLGVSSPGSMWMSMHPPSPVWMMWFLAAGEDSASASKSVNSSSFSASTRRLRHPRAGSRRHLLNMSSPLLSITARMSVQDMAEATPLGIRDRRVRRPRFATRHVEGQDEMVAAVLGAELADRVGRSSPARMHPRARGDGQFRHHGLDPGRHPRRSSARPSIFPEAFHASCRFELFRIDVPALEGDGRRSPICPSLPPESELAERVIGTDRGRLRLRGTAAPSQS